MHKILQNHQKTGVSGVSHPGVAADPVPGGRYHFSRTGRSRLGAAVGSYLLLLCLLLGSLPLLANGPGEGAGDLVNKDKYVSWGFGSIWDIASGSSFSYPYLRENVQNPAPGLGELFADGDGSEDDPYQIADWHQLNRVRDYLDKHFVLIDDLDENSDGYQDLASTTANAGKGWQPIGVYRSFSNGVWSGDAFTGTFDGNNKKISGLNFNRASTSLSPPLDELYVGLFVGIGATGLVKDLTLEGSIAGRSSVGGLTGINQGKIDNVHTNVLVDCSFGIAGGLVGRNEGEVINSSAAGNVRGSSHIGGWPVIISLEEL